MYQAYADKTYFENFTKNLDNTIPDDKVEYYLKQASRDIDTLTFNRIRRHGFYKLSEYQQEIIQEVCCEHASFLFDNADMLKTYLSNYSINGVSMTFGGAWNIYIESGIAVDRRLYERLCDTGLCCRSLMYG